MYQRSLNALVFGLLPMLMLCTSCQQTTPNSEPTPPTRSFQLTANSESQSRTTLEGLTIRWSPSDRVGVFSEKSPNALFTNTAQAATTSATFTGTLESSAAQVTAYYPYDQNVTFSNNTLTMVLPQAQPFVSNSSFADGLNPSVARGAIGESLVFRNCCGALKIRLTGNVTVESIEFTPKNGAASGAMQVGIAQSNTRPTTTLTAASGTSVRLTAIRQALDATTEKSYYLVLPAATYTGFTLRITDSAQQQIEAVSDKELTVKQAVVTVLSPLDITPETTMTPTFGQENFTEESWSWE